MLTQLSTVEPIDDTNIHAFLPHPPRSACFRPLHLCTYAHHERLDVCCTFSSESHCVVYILPEHSHAALLSQMGYGLNLVADLYLSLPAVKTLIRPLLI